MWRFLFTTQASDDLGLLTRTLPVARELAHRGHQVAFCNPAAAPRKLIAEAGFDNFPLKHPLDFLAGRLAARQLNLPGLFRLFQSGQLQREYGGLFRFGRQLLRAIPTQFAAPTTQLWSVDHLFAVAGALNENFVRVECEALLALIADYQPDVVVDSWNPYACLAARAAHTPLATILQADMHPASRGFIWWKEPPSDLPSPAPVFSKILADYHLPPIRKTEELFVGDVTLIVGTPETDPLPETAGVTYVGPLVWQKAEPQLPEWFSTLRLDQPVVWVYSGNPQYLPVKTPLDGETILRVCIAALATEDLQVILTTGHHALPKGVQPLPPNFRYAAYVPGLAMARRSDVLIHHGGYGSCQTGLCTGTPAVIIPTYSERESNARRVAAAGAGEFLVPGGNPYGALWGKWGVRAEELRAKVRQVLTDPAYRRNAHRISEKMQTYGGASAAARLIENLAGSTG
jgi:UDP:flavonoid glycosyltransferase YjiC (YdhE family)